MKSIKLIVGLLFIYSCSPVITNTLPSPSSSPTKSPNITATPTSSVIPSISVFPSVSVSSTPSVLVSSSPSPTMTPIPVKVFKSMRILNSLGQIMTEGSDYKKDYTNEIAYSSYKKYSYNSIFEESEKFTAEVNYTDGSVSKDDVVWSLGDYSIADVDSTGLVKVGRQEKSTKIQAAFKHAGSRSLEFNINVIPSYTINLSCDKTIIKEKFIPSSSFSENLDLISISGKVFDSNDVPVEGAIVNAKSIESNINWLGQSQITNERGQYIFRNVRPDMQVEITITKDGWTTRKISNFLINNSTENPCANVFNFGKTITEKRFAIQDEPEITQLKINEQLVSSSSVYDNLILDSNLPQNIKPNSEQLSNYNRITNIGNIPYLRGINPSNLEVEMTFSEPVNREDVVNYFRITSQSNLTNKPNGFIIDKSSNISFEWSQDDKIVKVKTYQTILANKQGEEARYLIDFVKPFRDKSDKSAIDRRYFRFSDLQINDFAVFSVKNN